MLWLAILVFPPAGLILLWRRPGWGFFRKLVGTVAITIIALVELVYVYGMRVVWNGSMGRIIQVSFESRTRHDSRLEASRALQRAHAPQPATIPAPTPVPVPNTVPAPVTAAAKAVPVSYWTDFRGPHRDGVYGEMAIDSRWPPPLLWKQPIGGGYASFSVGEGRAYTIEQRRDREAITAYDLETGRELWAFSYPAQFEEMLGGPGPRATPVYYEGLVYSLGANGDLYCLAAQTGKVKWSKNILADNDTKNVEWAMAGSPLIDGDQVIVVPGGAGAANGVTGKSIVAYQRLPGEPIWRSLNDRAAYTSPILATLGGRRQIVWISAERVVGIAPEDGKLLWEYPFPAMMGMNCSQPVIVDDSHIFLSSSQGPGAALLEITASEPREIWKNNRLKNKFNSSVLYQGYVYGFDESILACMDPKTGELKWKGGRYGYGQLLLAGDRLIVLTEDGDLALVRATPDGFQELARFAVLQGRTWNIPAIDHGLLLIRNTTEMACFRIGRGKE